MSLMNDVIRRTVRGPYRPRANRATVPREPSTFEQPNPQQWCGAAPAARRLNCSVGHLYRMVREGLIHQYRPEGSHQLFWVPELEAYVRRRDARD